jgi:hypothetical protein
MDTSINLQRRARLSLFLSAIVSIFSLVWLFIIPNEDGLSIIRLGMAIILSVGTLLSLVGLTSPGFKWISNRLHNFEIDSVTNRRRVFLLVLVILNGTYLLLLAPEAQDIVARAMLIRLSPIFFYCVVLSILGILLLLPTQLPTIQASIPRRIFCIAGCIFGGLLLGWALVWLTKWGLIRDLVGWNAMGIPILETYVLLAWLIVILAGKLFNIINQKFFLNQPKWRLDVLITICLYMLAVLSWRATPAPYNWFVTQPYPPNQESYPSSDALRYATTAQSLLIGEGLKTDNSIRTFRPLYTGLLAILHAISGSDYQGVIDLQLFAIAFFPVFLYFLGLQMHSRMAGFFLALLIIFREQTAIELSDRITISSAKLMMADLPTAVAFAGFTLLTIIWLKADKPRWQIALMTGGALGATMLIRSESLIFISVVIIATWLQWRKSSTKWLRQIVFFSVGLIIVVSPWIYRNWQRYDIIFFDAPNGRLNAVIERAFAVPPKLPEETPILETPSGTVIIQIEEIIDTTPNPRLAEEPTRKIIETPEETIDDAVTIIADRPQAVLINIINHYLNSEIQSILAIPTAFRLPDNLINFSFHKDINRFWRNCCQAIGYYERMPYWQSWGVLPAEAILPILGNLFLISIGIAIAYNQLNWAGLFPIMAHIVFLAGIALFRISGGRYILPVNWIIIVYYGLGVITLTIWAGKLLGWIKDIPGWNIKYQIDHPSPAKSRIHRWLAILVPVTGLLVLGSALPLLEAVYPKRYTPEIYTTSLDAVVQTLTTDEQEWLMRWLANENAAVRIGQALYPRFLKAGQGELDKDPGVMARDYDRLTFSLIGPYNLRVHLPLSELENGFPNGDDVLIVGCIYRDDNREVIDAQLIARMNMDGTVQEILWRADDHPSNCMP